MIAIIECIRNSICLPVRNCAALMQNLHDKNKAREMFQTAATTTNIIYMDKNTYIKY